MRAEVLSVGTELLLGQIVNSDAQYISQRLSALGIDTYFHMTCGDNAVRLKDCLALALSRSDIVITTGGLGPTQDDLTKETVAEYFGLALTRHEESYAKLAAFFNGVGREMTPNNVKQAYFPQGAMVLPNRKGTAPGCIVEREGKRVIILPGPPFELTDMFEQAVEPYLLALSDQRITSRVLRLFGIGESSLEHGLRDLIDSQTNPTIAPYAGYGEVTLRITYKGGRDDDADRYIAPVEEAIRRRYGQYVYATGSEPIETVVASALLDRGLTITTAESLTGGLLASRLIAVPGVSQAFLEGYVAYSNASKTRLLGVREGTLASFGAVSRETAIEMASGARQASGADIAVSTTGVAGPGGGTDAKPVGLVWIGVATAEGVTAKRLNLGGDRERIRNLSVLNALHCVLQTINGI